MMLEQDRKQKQTYLRQSILQNNYDPEQFIAYLNQKLGIDSDIDRCSMEQLKNVVKLFIEEKDSNIIQNSASLSSSQSIVVRKSSDKHSNVVFKDYSPPIVQEQFETNYKCIRAQNKYNNELLAQIRCQVSNPQRKYSGGLLGIGATSFLQFQIATPALGWLVGRRYSDFIWLRNTIRKLYPTHIAPPIPNKKASKRTVRHIEKRMRILSYFLNDLVKMPVIFNCKYVEGFLNIKDNSKFQNLKKEADSKVVYESIASTESESGYVKINLSNDLVHYCNNLRRFVDRSEVLYKELTRGSKRFQSQKIDEVNQLYDMGNKFAELYETGKQFQGSAKLGGVNLLNQIYIKLNNMMIEWGNTSKTQIQLLEVNFNTFFKYARQSYMGFKESLDRIADLEKSFISMKTEIDTRKQKIFLLHDPNKWQIPKKQIPFIPKSSIHQRTEAFKIMLPKESIEVQKLKINYSFHLTRLYQNTSFYFQKQVQKFNDNFKQFAIKQKVNNQQIGQNWNQMCMIFSMPNSGSKKLKQMQKIEQLHEGPNVQMDD